MERFQLGVKEPAPAGAIGLLLPVPPETHFQQPIAARLLHGGDEVTLLHEARQGQAAFVLKVWGDSRIEQPLVEYRMALQSAAANPRHYGLANGASLAITEDVLGCDERIFAGMSHVSQLERLRIVVDYLTEHFDYIHHEDELNRGVLSCTHLRGDCLDINTALMKLLGLHDVESAYYIGCYFERGSAPRVDDWHCWVSTRIDGIQDWDIAHHIKRRLGQVEPALNPVAGTRFALSCGRDLAFEYDERLWRISHLGAPIWLLADGSHRQAVFTAQHLMKDI